MTALAEPARSAPVVDTLVGHRVVRFDRAERALHWTMAVAVLVLLATGTVLYVGPLSAAVGRRTLVKNIHVVAGLLLPLPLVLAALAANGRRRRATSGLRLDAARISRWTDDDRRWLRSRGRSGSVRLGKFNAGQKLNALFLSGALGALLVSGLVMRFFEPFPDSWRTGATFVHDVFFFGVFIAVVGHIAKAISEPVALRSMVDGTMPVGWVEKHHPRWYRHVTGADQADDDTGTPVEDR